MNLWNYLRDAWKSPTTTVTRIEVLVLVSIALLFLIAIFGTWRRRFKHWFIQMGITGAYLTAVSLGTYNIGSMQSSAVKSEMYPVWAVSFLVVLASTSNITAVTLDDNYRIKRQVYQIALYVGYVMVIAYSISSNLGGAAIVVLCFVAWTKVHHRLWACLMASRSWNSSKMVADYMDWESTRNNDCDPVSLKGYRYLVDWPLEMADSEAWMKYVIPPEMRQGDGNQVDWLACSKDRTQDIIITTEEICHIDGKLLSPTLKDACLSFSLFHLLKRRFFGFSCGESKQKKTHDFVINGLLSMLKKEDGTVDCEKVERTFKVIEAELAFAYDFLFTKYAVLYYGSTSMMYCAITSIIGIAFVGALTFMRAMRIDSASDSVVIVNATVLDFVITAAILASLVLMEMLQVTLFWMSDWGRVAYVREFVRERMHSRQKEVAMINGNSTWHMRLKAYLASTNHFLRNCYWEQKLGQYSLLDQLIDSTETSEPWKYPLALLVALLNIGVLSLRRHVLSHKAVRRGRAGVRVKLTVDVKKKIVLCLKGTNNGASSLQSYGLDELLWACAQDSQSLSWVDWHLYQGKDTQTHVILTWHVATCYCEMVSPTPCNEYQSRKTATHLSRYCAYLVRFEPELLPGNHYETTCMLGEVELEARREVLREGKAQDICEAMRRLEESEETIFKRGVKLGKQLERMLDDTTRWEVLEDFWAEMLLYVAPSDQVKEHMERLVQGGEFITHLWALLFHAGIVKRDEPPQYGAAAA